MLLCGVLNAVGSGLLSLFSPTTPTGQWVGCQVLLGIGRGLGVSMVSRRSKSFPVRTISEPPVDVPPPQPILAIQHALPKSQIPTGMSIFVFCQMFGGAIMVVFSQAIFTNSLRQTIPTYAPPVDAETIIAAGATQLRRNVPSNELGGVLLAYSKSLDRIYYLTASIAVISLFLSYFMGWKDLRKKEEATD